MSKEFTSELALSLQGQLAAPVLEFPGGDQAFSFPLQHSSGSSGFAFRGSPGLSLLWQIEASDPCSVLIQLLDGTTDRPAKSLRLSFSNELLPNLSCTPTETGAYVVAVTSDGRLHKLTFSLSQEDSLEEGSPSLRCTHKYASILPALERSGFPTYVQVCAEKICIGTSRGSVICLDPSLDLASISELKSGYNLPKVISGFFSQAQASGITQLFSYDYLDHCFLCAIHTNSQLRFWDVHSKMLIHTVDLLPSELVSSFKPGLARVIEEPMDASLSVLLVHFQSEQGLGQLHTYSVMIEQRGDRSFMVNVENGARLQSGISELRDMKPVALGRQSVGAWMLYEDTEGHAQVQCIPVAFSELAVQPALSTHLIGSTLHGVLSTSNPVALAAIWNRVSEKLSPRNGVSVQDIFQTAFINLLLHPVWYNHSALLRSIQTILPSTSVSHISPSNSPDAVGSLVLERWKTRGGDTKSLLELWLGILEVYVAEFERETRPLGFGHIAISAAIPGSPAIIRRGGVLSCITPGSFSESAMLGGDLLSEKIQNTASFKLLLAALSSQDLALGGGMTPWLLSAAVQHGIEVSSLASVILEAADLGTSRVNGPGDDKLGEWRRSCRRHAVDCWKLGSSGIDFASLLDGVTDRQASLPSGELPPGIKIDISSALPAGPVATALASRIYDVAVADLTFLWHLVILLENQKGSIASSKLLGDRFFSLARDKALSQIALCVAWMWASTVRLEEDDPSLREPSRMLRSLHIEDSPAPPKRSRPAKQVYTVPVRAYVSQLLNGVAKGWDPSREASRNFLGEATTWTLALSSAGSEHPPWLLLAQLLVLRGHFGAAGRFSSSLERVDPRSTLAFAWTSFEDKSAGTSSLDLPSLQVCMSTWFRWYCCLKQGNISKKSLESINLLGQALLGDDGKNKRGDYLTLILDVLDAKGAHESSVDVACVAANESGLHSSVAEANFWHRAMTSSLKDHSAEDSYIAAIASPSEHHAEDIREIVLHTKKPDDVRKLLGLPLADVVSPTTELSSAWTSLFQIAVTALRFRAASDHLLDSSNAYQILYRLLLRRGCFQAAADSMYEFAARLQSELRADIAVLRLAEDSLQLALGALRMVDRRHPNTVVESGTNEKALEQELARIGARIAGVLSGLDVLQLNDAELVEVLVEAERYKESISFALSIFEGSALTSALNKILTLFAGSVSKKSFEDENPDPQWDQLRSTCRALETAGHSPCVAVARGIFGWSTSTALPPWLEQQILDQPSTLTDIIKLSIEYGRLSEAARSAHLLLDRLAATPIKLAYVPHDLLTLLVDRLGSAGLAQEEKALSYRARILLEH